MVNAAQLFGLDDDSPKDCRRCGHCFSCNLKQMHSEARQEQNHALKSDAGLHEIGYRKGKVTAFWEALQLLKTGEKPN